MARGNITVSNRDTRDLFVTIKDMNSAGSPKIWDQQRLNRDERKTIVVEIDGNGDALVEWFVVSTDDNTDSNSGEERVDENSSFDVFT